MTNETLKYKKEITKSFESFCVLKDLVDDTNRFDKFSFRCFNDEPDFENLAEKIKETFGNKKDVDYLALAKNLLND